MTSTETGPGPGPDISTKYQKLATEYAKLRLVCTYLLHIPRYYLDFHCRAQMTVLKKGLLDEQDKNSLLSDQV